MMLLKMVRRVFFALALLFPVAAHAALPCSAYPNTLTNGTLADANQVMANFNTILNCVNSLAPLGTPVVGQISNVKSSLTSASSTVAVSADSVTVGTALNGTSYTLTSYSQTFNGATTGAGGMDIGTLPTSGWVALYAIYNPTAPTISILGTSCATSCPTIYSGGNMPAGYTASAILEVLPTNATPLIAPGYVKGKQFTYSAQQIALTTAINHGSFTSLSLTSFVPPNATYVQLSGILIAGTTPGAVNMSVAVCAQNTDSCTNQTAGFSASNNGTTIAGSLWPVPLVTAQTVFYFNTNAGTSPTTELIANGYTIP